MKYIKSLIIANILDGIQPCVNTVEDKLYQLVYDLISFHSVGKKLFFFSFSDVGEETMENLISSESADDILDINLL